MFEKFVFMIFLASSSGVAKETCPNGEYWVSPHPRKAYERADGKKVSATFVTGHCRSKGKIYDFWESSFTNGLVNGWPHKSEKLKEWGRNDIEVLLRALKKVPYGLWEKVKIFRAEESQSKGNPATSAGGIIVFYNKAFENKSLLPRYIAHELAHQKFYEMNLIDQMAFQQAAGWKIAMIKGRPKLKLTRSQRVAGDSDLGPEEDFANSMEFFIFEPLKLKIKSPELYDWFNIQYADSIKGMKGREQK